MKTIKFRNEKGQYCPENVNHGFEIDYSFFRAVCKRSGQESPETGNRIVVCLEIEKTGNPEKFNENLFGIKMSEYYVCQPKWQYGLSFLIKFEYKKMTWREAFKEAKDYVFSEIEKYEALIREREQALIDAEF